MAEGPGEMHAGEGRPPEGAGEPLDSAGVQATGGRSEESVTDGQAESFAAGLSGLRDLAARLEADRATPAPDFRGRLRRYLVATDPGYGPRPARLRATVALYLSAGAGLMALGAGQSLGLL